MNLLHYVRSTYDAVLADQGSKEAHRFLVIITNQGRQGLPLMGVDPDVTWETALLSSPDFQEQLEALGKLAGTFWMGRGTDYEHFATAVEEYLRKSAGATEGEDASAMALLLAESWLR